MAEITFRRPQGVAGESVNLAAGSPFREDGFGKVDMSLKDKRVILFFKGRARA